MIVGKWQPSNCIGLIKLLTKSLWLYVLTTLRGFFKVFYFVFGLRRIRRSLRSRPLFLCTTLVGNLFVLVGLFVLGFVVFWGFVFLTSYIPIYYNGQGDARTYHLQLLTKQGNGYIICYLKCSFLTSFSAEADE